MKKLFCIVALVLSITSGFALSTPSDNLSPPDIVATAPAVTATIPVEFLTISAPKPVDSFVGGVRFNPNLQTLISFRGGVSQVLSQRVGTLHDFFGRHGLDVDVNVFGGFSFTAEGLTGGVSLTKRFNVSRELAADVGLYGQAIENKKLDFGIFIGASLRF